jgi:hypothetical protein
VVVVVTYMGDPMPIVDFLIGFLSCASYFVGLACAFRYYIISRRRNAHGSAEDSDDQGLYTAIASQEDGGGNQD